MADADVDIAADCGGDAAAAHRRSEAAAHAPIASARCRSAGKKHAEAHRRGARAGHRGRPPSAGTASPISLARLSAELWAQIKNEDWSLVSWQGFVSGWPGRLWNFDKHYRYIGGQGAGAMGYGAPAAVGAALANRKYGRLRSTSRPTAT